MQANPRVIQKSEIYVCVHAGEQVEIQSAVVYPIGFLSSSPPRIVQRSCDHYVDCHLADKAACPVGLTQIN